MTINVQSDSGVYAIEIARPEKKNAFTGDMYRQLAHSVQAADDDDAIGAILIFGQPDIFSAGNDLEDFLADSPKNNGAPVFQFMRALISCNKPVVAAVRGPAVGIGVTMLLHCDLVFIADDTRLMMPFVGLGLVPEFASSLLLPQLAGQVRAAEYLLLGSPMSAAAAVECGIANAALPSGQVLQHALATAGQFNSLPREAVRATKQLLRRWTRAAALEAVDAEAAIFIERLASPEAQATVNAFLSKRGSKR